MCCRRVNNKKDIFALGLDNSIAVFCNGSRRLLQVVGTKVVTFINLKNLKTSI